MITYTPRKTLKGWLGLQATTTIIPTLARLKAVEYDILYSPQGPERNPEKPKNQHILKRFG
ncbi:hypothetical protein LINPERHAP1_LOCUS33799 [Linum perenne]